ncbi:MAG: M14 family zinc carboxypeptidase, partial [Bacteroidetes bacterium]|nr:M14 family zinc carboxypeptidase [Bacteroidota bacterium]
MKNLFLSLFCLLFLSSFSQTLTKSQEKTVNKLFKNKTEVYFTFPIADKSEISVLTTIISIDNVKDGKVWAYANNQEFRKFLLLNYAYTILPNPGSVEKHKTKRVSSVQQLKALSAYPTYSSYEAMMSQFAIDHPTICKLVNIGTLPSGHKLLMLKITDNINVREDEPQFLYTSSMHGDETSGYIGMLNYIDYLLSNYGTNARVTSLVNSIEIWICPLANPDGTYAGGDATVTGATRYNANAIDLNRNYPDPQAGQHPDGNAWQPETQFFMSFADSKDFVMAANFHGGAEVANYPWDTWATLHADDNWWKRESKKYADTVFANSPAGYFTSVTPTGYTNGFVWYQVTGGRQDYMNYYKHCREFTVETSNTKLMPASDFTNNWNENYKSYLNYMEESLHGIRGIVKDACTNQPVKAKIFISGHDFDSSHVYTSLPVGNYHRPIYQGTYSVTFSAPGYVSQTISGINVTLGAATVVNVNLSPLAPIANVSINSFDHCSGVVDFNDLSGSASSWSWRFGDGGTSSVQNPTHVYTANGTYSVSLVVSNCAGGDSIYKINYVVINIPDLPLVASDSSLVCGPTSLNLGATGSGVLNWYSVPSGGSVINTGTSYTTPVLSTTTNYYVENSVAGASQYVGPINNTIGAGGYFTAATYHYLKFTSTNAFKLISVWVNASTTANRTIQLRNSAGTVLQSAIINIPAGSSRITLNFNVPVGTDLQLGVAGANNLYRNSAGGAYPYNLSGIVSITGNSAANLAYYYYFYDWEIAQSCISSRVIVSAIINTTDPVSNVISSPDFEICAGDVALFNAAITNGGGTPFYQWQVNGINAGPNSSTFSSSSLSNGDVISCVVNSSNVCATNNPAASNVINLIVHPLPTTPVITQAGTVLNSNALTGNQWYNSSGLIVGATGISYTPTVDGGYYVIVTDINGCSSDTSNVINFISTGIVSFDDKSIIHMYPNPCGEELFIDVISNSNKELTVDIVNPLGVLIYSEKFTGNKLKINSGNFPNGIYFLT